jgi:signal transduction histidine kinase
MNEEVLAPGSGAGSSSPQALGIGEDLNRLIVAASADGIIAVDDEGIIRLCNQAAAKLLSRPADQLIGSPFGFPLVSGRAAEVSLMRPAGDDRVVDMRTSTTTLDGTRLHIVALRDVTLHRQAERDLAAALDRQKVVLAVAAHEFRSPLSALGVLAQTLADQQWRMTPTERADLIDRIVRLTVRLQLLVRSLLTAAKIEEGDVRANPEAVPVLEVILEQLADIGTSAEDVQVSCSPALTLVADRAACSIMLANYLDNALNYGGPPVEIHAFGQEGWAEIRVIDHGPGVPASFAPHMFERFARAPGAARKAEGTGLGLWIVRAFAAANGGDAWYEPAQGGGACFCLRLPLGDAPRSAPASG